MVPVTLGTVLRDQSPFKDPQKRLLTSPDSEDLDCIPCGFLSISSNMKAVAYHNSVKMGNTFLCKPRPKHRSWGWGRD